MICLCVILNPLRVISVCYIEDACGGSSPHPLELETLHVQVLYALLLRFLDVGWECVPRWSSEGASGPLGAIRGPVGKETFKKPVSPKKCHLIWSPFWDHFQSLNAIKIALKFQCVSEGSFRRLWGHLWSQREPQRVRRGVILTHFGATSENVKTMLPSGRNHYFGG